MSHYSLWRSHRTSSTGSPWFTPTKSNCIRLAFNFCMNPTKRLCSPICFLQQQLENTDQERSIDQIDFKRAFICVSFSIDRNSVDKVHNILHLLQILYVLVSFFGTGNIASVSSFDPNWVRCFVSTFSPFLMASLIILKLLIPVLLVMCAVRQIHSITNVQTRFPSHFLIKSVNN